MGAITDSGWDHAAHGRCARRYLGDFILYANQRGGWDVYHAHELVQCGRVTPEHLATDRLAACKAAHEALRTFLRAHLDLLEKR